jgi:AraC family transcriptional regulator
MLRYFAHGPVRWKNGMRCNTRTNWEFYAVTSGRCGLRFSDHEPATMHERTLWVFAPECSHAWADDGRTYERISLHFGSVPYPLDEVVRANGGWLEKKLDSAEVAQLSAMATNLEPTFCRPTLVSALRFQRQLIDLALMMLEGRESSHLPPTLTDLANFKIERALSWYGEHLPQNPTVKQVADAIHVSPSHLRRLFWQARKTNPKSAFVRLRLDKANELMGRSSLTLDEVAMHCGYSSASHLCSDYKAVHHFTPTTWRKKLIDRFIQPPPPGMNPVREYSARPEERTMRA